MVKDPEKEASCLVVEEWAAAAADKALVAAVDRALVAAAVAGRVLLAAARAETKAEHSEPVAFAYAPGAARRYPTSGVSNAPN